MFEHPLNHVSNSRDALMAICPKCNSTIGMTAAKCESCGYDFPQPKISADEKGWEYSVFSEVALVTGAICSLILSFVATWMSVNRLFSGAVFDGSVGLMQALVLFALFVVFTRINSK